MFNSFINKSVYQIAFASGFAFHKTADGLRAAATQMDKMGDKCGAVALEKGLAAGILLKDANGKISIK